MAGVDKGVVSDVGMKERSENTVCSDAVPYAASVLPGQASTLADMLQHMNELDDLPQLQVSQPVTTDSRSLEVGNTIPQPSTSTAEDHISQSESGVAVPSSDQSFPRIGRPRTRPQREKNEWHYHLGGVRHCRVPLSADLKEVLEVAYVSRIMSKNFRKEGQPEKERLAKVTGMNIDKIQEWFKNRRKKDRLLQDRAMGRNLPKTQRGHKSVTSPP